MAADQPRSEDKAKQAVDSPFVRMGDVMQAGLVFLGERLVFRRAHVCGRDHRGVGAWLGVVTLLNGQLRAKADQAGTRQLRVSADSPVRVRRLGFFTSSTTRHGAAGATTSLRTVDSGIRTNSVVP